MFGIGLIIINIFIQRLVESTMQNTKIWGMRTYKEFYKLPASFSGKDLIIFFFYLEGKA